MATRVVYQIASLDEPRPWGRIFQTRKAAFAAMKRHNAIPRTASAPGRPWPLYLRKLALSTQEAK